MTDVYQTPEADLVDLAAIQPFYIVSIKKFNILFYGTAALYGVYWFYRHWKAYKLANSAKIMPVMRAIFSYFFIVSLFRRIDEHAQEQNIHLNWNPRRQGIFLVLVLLVSAILGYWPQSLALIISIVLLVPQALLMSRAQTCANMACQDPMALTNNSFTVANYLWMLIGLAAWVFYLATALLPEA